MKIVIYGLTITSSWGNGHATTYRSLVKALARKQHRVQFIERDVEWYRSNRDLPNPEFCDLRLYEDWQTEAGELIGAAADADAVIVGSYFPDAIAATTGLLEAGHGPLLFYDIDTPVTMARLQRAGATEYLDASLIPYYAVYLSFTGGPALRELEDTFGSPRAVPLYCSVDPDLYRPVAPAGRYCCELSYLGTYAADRQPKLMQFLDGAAELMPSHRFVVAGAQYPKEIEWSPNVERITHVYPRDHPTFYSSSRFTLNLTRDAMVEAGYSPSVRLFEAAACGATIVSDWWAGLEEFLSPGEEILLPSTEYELAEILQEMPDCERRRMGERARERIVAHHSSAERASQLERIVADCYARRA